ncbi:MAG: TIGR02147 family protein [Chitinispirillaceae bacterium]|nr:TIGR02147 family protein [Chitinispirillaceae bacterium]
MKKPMVPIYDYMDYRQYLQDFFEEKKRELRFYSYRLFSQRAGLKSPNFLKLVIKGERNLSKHSVYKFAKAMALAKKETEYFENLIFFNQSDLLEEKNLYLMNLMKYRKKSDTKTIEEAEYEYYTQWHTPVIRELVCAANFRDDYKRLGAAVIPSITAADAKRAVELLLKLKFITRNPDGTYAKSAASLTTGQGVRSVAVANFHRSMLQLANDAIDRFSPPERDITCLTMSVAQETIPLIVERLQQLRTELLELAGEDERADRVVQLNLQLFPLSQMVIHKDRTP